MPWTPSLSACLAAFLAFDFRMAFLTTRYILVTVEESCRLQVRWKHCRPAASFYTQPIVFSQAERLRDFAIWAPNWLALWCFAGVNWLQRNGGAKGQCSGPGSTPWLASYSPTALLHFYVFTAMDGAKICLELALDTAFITSVRGANKICVSITTA
jgi:hypothetical protein